MIRLYLGRPGEAARLAMKSGETTEERGRGIERERGREQAAAEVAGTKRADRLTREAATKKGMANYAEQVTTMDWLGKIGEGDGDSAMGDIGEEGPSTSGRDGGDDDRWVLHFYVKDTGIGLDEVGRCRLRTRNGPTLHLLLLLLRASV